MQRAPTALPTPDVTRSRASGMRPSAWTTKFIFLSLVFLGSAVCVFRVVFDNDTLWHIPTGEWILSHGAVPKVDVFSSTKLGAPWLTHEWLSEVLFAEVYRIAGWTGVLVLTSGGFALAFALLAFFLEDRPRPASGLILLVLAFALCIVSFSARPVALVAPALVVWATGLISAVEDERTPSLLLLPLMTIWANLHGSFIIGLASVGLFMMEALSLAHNNQGRVAAGVRWGAFGLYATLASLITPHGINGILFPFYVQRMHVALKYISEWQPYSVATILDPLLLWLMVVIAFAAAGKLRLRFVRLLGVLALLYLTLRHHRHVLLLGLLSPVLLATPFCGTKRGGLARARESNAPGCVRGLGPSSEASRLALVFAAAGGLAVGIGLRGKPFYPEQQYSAEKAIEYAQEAGLGDRVLNEYGFGGSLIFNGLAPFIDGRADMYGDAFLEKYLEAVNLSTKDAPKPLLKLLDEYKITWTLFAPTAPVLAVLRMNEEWSPVFSDDYAVIFQRGRLNPRHNPTTRLVPPPAGGAPGGSSSEEGDGGPVVQESVN